MCKLWEKQKKRERENTKLSKKVDGVQSHNPKTTTLSWNQESDF